MCQIFSGHINANKESKDWGKVYFITGIHHEIDRKEIKEDKLLAWESVREFSLDKFTFTHDCGLSLPEEDKKALMNLIEGWAKDKNPIAVLKEKFVSVSVKGENTTDYLLDLDNKVIALNKDGVSIITPELSDFTQTAGYKSTQTAGYKSTQTAGGCSTQTAGYRSTQTAGNESTQTAGDYSTQTAGYKSTQTAGYRSTQTAGNESTQTAGYRSTQTAGHWSTQTAGNESTQTAGNESTQIIHGNTSYIILNGKNVMLTQLYLEGYNFIRKVVFHDDLFAKGYKKGDKLKIVRGEVEG